MKAKFVKLPQGIHVISWPHMSNSITGHLKQKQKKKEKNVEFNLLKNSVSSCYRMNYQESEKNFIKENSYKLQIS